MRLSGFHSCQLWDILVLQAAQVDAGIRHALIALASTHQMFENQDRVELDLEEFSVQQYNLAIRYHLDSLTYRDSSENLESYLVSCIIFICIEVSRGIILGP